MIFIHKRAHIDGSVEECCNFKKADLRKLHKKIDEAMINCQFTGSIEHQGN